MTYQTPGVYTEEISLFPPSIAQVETAIPAFIGYTEINLGGNNPVRITSLLEYEHFFGKAAPQTFTVTLDSKEPHLPQSVKLKDSETPYKMYEALQLFYANGGGPCYIVSVGDFEGSDTHPSLDGVQDFMELNEGLKKIRKIDEVTLIVIPEATELDPNDQYDLYDAVLKQCGELKDRFGIFDLPKDAVDATNFRAGIGTSYLSYGAAYFPYLKTNLPFYYTPASIDFAPSDATEPTVFDNYTWQSVELLLSAIQTQTRVGQIQTEITQAHTQAKQPLVLKPQKMRLLQNSYRDAQKTLQIVKEIYAETEVPESSNFTDAETSISSVETIIKSSPTNADIIRENPSNPGAFQILTQAFTKLKQAIDDLLEEIETNLGINTTETEEIKKFYTNKFKLNLQQLLETKKRSLPPSSIIAGIYAKVDNERGVWKSPANVSINRVIGPAQKLTVEENDNLNVDSSGKSVNAIRAFTGKGTLVWGARTLDGNSNEWRYISVRRFFNMVEESCKKASLQFVFEPNSANTWVKVKAMIENYLILQWRTGALMGAKSNEAFFVNIGLGQTMTQDDINNGKMIIEIGMAVVRPAEFIILRFSHKMIES